MSQDSDGDLLLGQNELVAKPISPPGCSLGDLLAEITVANRHDEVETFGTVGEEPW